MKLVFLQQQFLPRLFLKAYHGRTSCFILYWSNMQYTKQAMDFYCQLDILKERGLTIEDEEDAIKFLHSVSYFRFANYLQPMELNTESHRFAQNSSFTFATNFICLRPWTSFFDFYGNPRHRNSIPYSNHPLFFNGTWSVLVHGCQQI